MKANQNGIISSVKTRKSYQEFRSRNCISSRKVRNSKTAYKQYLANKDVIETILGLELEEPVKKRRGRKPKTD